MRKPIIFTLIAVLVILLLFIEIRGSFPGSDTHEELIDFIKVHRGVVDFYAENLNQENISTIPVTVAGNSFQVTTRQDKMTIQNCAACHEGPVEPANALQRKSHWEILSPHGKAETLNCATCHNASDANRLNAGLTTVGFDESFRLCATCHFKELRDWSGGAHGKRVGGWAGERIINNCTACHDPHSPQFPRRRPSIMSPIPGG